jgi:precorrin-2/cobalt-factor-2 C20-methyltransferase
MSACSAKAIPSSTARSCICTTGWPAVSALTACAAASGKPLVRRDDVLSVLPATLPDAELQRRLADSDAAAILKVGRHLPRLRQILARQNLSDRAVYVAHATRRDERVLPMSELADDEAPYFSMILISKAAS